MDRVLELWEKLSIEREGYENTVYLDHLGNPTVGIGHKVRPEDNLKQHDYIDDERVEKLFQADTSPAYKKALEQSLELGKTYPWFIAELISVNFQLGDFKNVFPTTFGLLKQGAWQAAVSNLQSSRWATQTPVRVDDLISAIRKAYRPNILTKLKNFIGA